MIVILDYGLGNVGSIYNMCKYLGFNSLISYHPNDIKTADFIILPGVGSFDEGISLLRTKGFFDILNYQVLNKKVPVLGICLGMQLMTRGSEEGNLEGLGWFDNYCKKFNQSNLKIPHIGWNAITPLSGIYDFFPPVEGDRMFYFAHSFHIANYNDDVLATCEYGIRFPVVMKKENIIGVQFHPEKSHHFGMNFFNSLFKFYNIQ